MQKGIDIYIRKILYPIRYIFLGYGSYLSQTLLYYQPILGLDCANPLQPFFGFAFRAFYGTAPCRQRFENLRVWAELFMSPSAQPMRLPSGVMKGAIFLPEKSLPASNVRIGEDIVPHQFEDPTSMMS